MPFLKESSDNPYFVKLRKALSNDNNKMRIKKAYFLFGFLDSIEGRNRLKTSTTLESLKDIKEQTSYDVSLDNLELYFVADVDNRFYIIVLLDPYELYEVERLLQIGPAEEDILGIGATLIFEHKQRPSG